MREQETTGPASSGARVPETIPGPGDTLPRLLLAHWPLGPLVRRVAAIRASVHAKLLGAFLLVALLLIAMGAASLQAVAGVSRHSRLLDQARERVDAARQIEHALRLQMDVTRNALLTRDEATIASVLRESGRFDETFGQLEAAGPPGQRETIARLRAARDRVVATVTRVAALIRDGQPDEAMALHLTEAAPLYREIAPLVTRAVRIEEEGMDGLRQDLQATHRRALVLVGGFAAAALALALILGFVTSWSFILPIRQAEGFLGRVARGDFGASMDVPNRDELGAMAGWMNQMSRELRRLDEDQRRAAHELEARNRELTEALEQQTATAEVLRAISSSPTDIQPVLEAVVGAAARFCGATDVLILRLDGAVLRPAAGLGHFRDVIVRELGSLGALEVPATRGAVAGRAVVERRVVHVDDLAAEPLDEFPAGRELQRRLGHRTMLAAPLLREGVPVGAIGLFRMVVEPFSDRQIELLRTFADQAVIAIENVRLFTEVQARNRALSEALDQQTATGEILRVISGSPTDVQPVFDAIVRSATRLCDAAFGTALRFDGRLISLEACHGMSPEELAAARQNYPRRAAGDSASGRAIAEGRVVHIADVREDPEYRLQSVREAPGFRTVLAVPMLRDTRPIGSLSLWRREVRPFTDQQVALVKTFADQAVIAIENVRLFQTLEARNRDLMEALEQQTATSEVLKVISRSAFDLQPVLETVVESATRLCGATRGHIFRYDGEFLRFAAAYGAWPGFRERLEQMPVRPGPGSIAGRAAAERRTVHVDDVRALPGYEYGDLLSLQDYRSVLAVPMLREGVLVGVITVLKSKVEPFTDRQIELVTTFADQAVIAVENVRLFQALEARNHELSEALEQQAATAEILQVISSSPTDIQPVLDAVAATAARLCEAQDVSILRRDGPRALLVAHHGSIPFGPVGAFSLPLVPGTTNGRAMLEMRTIHVPDLQVDAAEFPEGSETARRYGFRAVLTVPLIREGAAIGTINLRRTEARLFSDRQVGLLRTFADQAVIAIENVRLFQELQARHREVTEALEQQTATSEILGVISGSPTDAQPVFDTIARSAAHLCEAQFCFVFRFDGEGLYFAAQHGLTPEGEQAIRVSWAAMPTPTSGTAAGRAVLGRTVALIPDVQADPDYVQGTVAEIAGFRSTVGVPMLRDGVPIGAITVSRARPGLFPERHVDLLRTFADQAVIAIENVRLFQELEARNRDLTETLEQQTATSEILRVISSSPTDVQPVFDTIVQNARDLCGADSAAVFTRSGEMVHIEAIDNANPDQAQALRRAYPMPANRGHATGRAILAGRPVHIPDVREDAEYALEALRDSVGLRTLLSVPMLRDGAPIGAITVQRWGTPRSFSDTQVALLSTFADQAVIAIENVRLFQELQARTRELTRSVGELRALGEVSQAVSSSLELETVLATIVSRAVELSGSYSGIVYEFEEPTQTFHARATHRVTPEHLTALRAAPIRLGEGAVGRAGTTRSPVEVADLGAGADVVAPQVREFVAGEGVQSLLAVPLVRDEQLLGGLVILRRERGAFSPEIVAILETFAAQSVLAIHNARLFREIHRQKQYADALVETSPVAIVTMDHDGVVVSWNPGAERLFGYTQAEALGRPMADLVSTPDRRDEVQANVLTTVAGESIRAITRRARKDGTLVDVEISTVPVVVDGTRAGIIGIYHDVTELLRARREAETANEAKGAFLATMSHEIRTPMNAVIGMSGLLLGTPLSAEQREYAEVIRQSGDALLGVINDILDFSKIEAGKLELEAQPFDVRECVEGVLDLVATRAAEKGLDLAYLIADGTPAAVVGDVARLRQVLLNLLSNAVKFTEHGEVVLSLSARRPDDASPAHELLLAVRDTGIGIPPDRLGRLFKSFSQVDASTTRRYGGTGLGLAISQRLAELMGGRIEVTSEVGRGSEFRLTIRAAEAAALPRRDLGGVQPSLLGKRVLVVDDNATNRRILATHLGAWGMEHRATGSPREALGWVRAGERFDAGILDMHMPEMDGAGLARALRECPAGAALPLVLFTSLGRREAAAESAGFAAYLHKPIKPSQLFDALVSVLADRPIHVPQRGVARSVLDPEMARRHPLRILLAEDNVVNQKVALRLLEQMGYRADVAGNGLEAVEAVARQAYDVVLMDVQMPELDGFEASREINRRWPGRRPRIVAMTANAMQGDRELCAAAGMDDYVAKPIRVEELVDALARCRPRPEAGARAEPAPIAAEPAATGDGAVDRTVIARLTASMGAAFVGELIDTFDQDARELVATLRQALAAGDLDAFRRAAHSLKSTSESLGATALAALARELEAAARAGSLDGAAARVERLASQHERAARVLEEIRRGLPA